MKAHGQGGQALHVGTVDQLLATDDVGLKAKETSRLAAPQGDFRLVSLYNCKHSPHWLLSWNGRKLLGTFSYAYCSCSMMGNLSRKALMQGAMLRPTTPCFFSAERQVAST